MTQTDQPLVRASTADGLATITLARPQAGNAMSWDLIDAFAVAVATVTADPAVRAVLIEAEGKHFCVGGDIKAIGGEADPAAFIEKLARRLHEALAQLAAHPAPVVIAVQGAAAGAGLSLAASGDIVLAGRSASFSMAYTGIGLTADGGATWLLPRLIGLRRAQEMAYAGRRLDAAQAEADGLVTRVVEDAALADEARAVATKIASGPTAAFGALKRLFAETGRATFPEQLDAEAAVIGQAMASADAAEGFAAFVGRRTPAFQGR